MASVFDTISAARHDGFLKSCEDIYKTNRAKLDDKTNPKEAVGATKPMLGLNPSVALVWMAKAFEFGAYGRDANGVQVREKGYGEFNWRESTIAEMVYVHAMQRHIADYLDGQDLASDSKVKHLGHVMACCAILLDAEECGTLKRNRPKPGKAADLIERLTIKKTPEFFEAIPLKDLQSKIYNQFEKEYLHDADLEFRPASPKRRRTRGRKVKADHHGRGRKARK